MRKRSLSTFIITLSLIQIFMIGCAGKQESISPISNKPLLKQSDKIYSEIFHPFIEDNWRLWGIEGDKLKTSDDFGKKWDLWFDFSSISSGKARLPIYGSVYLSKKGYIFVGLEDGKVYRSTEPYGRNFEVVNNLSNEKATLNVWNFTEDNDGVLYHGEYANLLNPDYNPEIDKKEKMFISVGYVYRSLNDGKKGSWEHIGPFNDKKGIKGFVWDEKTNNTGADKHIHNCIVDPYTNTLYVTYGDWNRYTMKSEDKGNSWSYTGAKEGFTGFTFTKNARLGATDFPHSSKNVFIKTTDDKDFRIVYEPPDSLDTATFDMHAHTINDVTRIIGIIHDEWDDELDHQSAIVVSEDEGESWNVLNTTPSGSKEPVYIGLSHGSNSIIPNGFPYWIISNHWTREKVGKEGKMHLTRIPVTELAIKIDVSNKVTRDSSITIKSGSTISFDTRGSALNGVSKLEVYSNDNLNQTLDSITQFKMDFKKTGTYKVKVILYDALGNKVESNTLPINVN